MPEFFTRLFARLFGDPRVFSLEHRLFNSISLINAIANVGGALGVRMSGGQNYYFLIGLHLLTGFLFLIFYYVSRFRSLYRTMYWPFVLLIVVFLFLNSIENAGSTGGAHYYFIPALVIATVLSRDVKRTFIAMTLFCLVTAGLLVFERASPEWITPYGSPQERFIDITGNFLFVQIFTSVLVLILSNALNQERRKSDQLLLNILPESIADELKRRGRVHPRHYESASVLFTDFVGFTKIAEHLSPEELIQELDTCFRRFDEIAARHKLEKIKTIGDSYMAAGGLPAVSRTHAVDCVLAALEIQTFMNELKAKRIAANLPCWELRLGIHSGRLVAGVIGSEKFVYDVWGDTVNTASRCESSGEAGRINISGETHALAGEFFECEYRGKVKAKNKGEIDMYFVNRLLPEFSAGQDGLAPNERFLSEYDRLRRGPI